VSQFLLLKMPHCHCLKSPRLALAMILKQRKICS
jgi:hypothetical protein